MSLKVWFRELRAPFLLLPTLFVPVALAMAWSRGSLDPLDALLTYVGIVALHAAVNILNDYFDYRSGIDLITTPTPFSGGSRILPNRELSPLQVLLYGLAFLGIGSSIGLYFLVKTSFDPLLLSILVVALVAILGYSPFFSKVGLGELMVGLCFGPLLALGTYYLQTFEMALEPLAIGGVLGLLTAGILYINQFPDHDADKEKGRYHLVVRLGKERAVKGFTYLMASAYALLVVASLTIAPLLALLGLLSLPKVLFSVRHLSLHYQGVMELVPAMASTVQATLVTGALLLLAYILEGLVVASLGFSFRFGFGFHGALLPY